MKSLSPKDMEVLRRAALFSSLSEEQLGRLLREAAVLEYPRGKLLFLRGEPASRFYLLLDGWVKVYRDTADGEQTVITIVKPGETLAEAAIFLGWDYPASAEVVDNARLLEIPGNQFLSILKDDSEVGIRMLAALSQRLRDMVLHIEQLQARSTPQRLGDFLLNLTEVREGPATIQLPYDKSLVAARLGMKPESLSRALAKLRTYGVRTKGNQVEIGDVDGLAHFCQGDVE